jgi:hypothetical protein
LSSLVRFVTLYNAYLTVMKKLVTQKSFCHAMVTLLSRDGYANVHGMVMINVQKRTDHCIPQNIILKLDLLMCLKVDDLPKRNIFFVTLNPRKKFSPFIYLNMISFVITLILIIN